MQIIGELLNDTAAASAVEQYIAERASRGLRALGVAQSHDKGATWELVGLISLLDPPRPDSAATIKHAQELGVEVREFDVQDQHLSAHENATVQPSPAKPKLPDSVISHGHWQLSSLHS